MGRGEAATVTVFRGETETVCAGSMSRQILCKVNTKFIQRKFHSFVEYVLRSHNFIRVFAMIVYSFVYKRPITNIMIANWKMQYTSQSRISDFPQIYSTTAYLHKE